MVGGERPLVPAILGQTDPIPSKMLILIFNRFFRSQHLSRNT